MVDPITGEDRERFYRRLKVAVTALVGVSAGLVALQVDPTPLQAAGAVVAGLVIGGALSWYVVPSGPGPAVERRSTRADRVEFGRSDASGDDGEGSEETAERSAESSSRRP